MYTRLKRNLMLLPLAAFLAVAPVNEAYAKRNVNWQSLLPGFELATVSAGKSARVGSDEVFMLRVQPELFSFKVLSAPKGENGHDAGEWREKTGALAVVNAGLFTPENSYLGLLIKDGKRISRLATRPSGLFVAEPNDPELPLARVIDMRYTSFDAENLPYRQAAQSIMLLDRFGNIRVRKSANVAHRTVLAQDAMGRILIIITKGAHTLWEFAGFLNNTNLKFREVMCMDGGPEAQLDLSVNNYKISQYGNPSATPDFPLPWPKASLPVALGIFPRKIEKTVKLWPR